MTKYITFIYLMLSSGCFDEGSQPLTSADQINHKSKPNKKVNSALQSTPLTTVRKGELEGLHSVSNHHRSILANMGKPKSKVLVFNQEAKLQRLRALQAEARLKESRRRSQLNVDWIELDKQLKSRGSTKMDKQNWVEAFVKKYGSVPELNPYVNTLSKWTHSMIHFDALVDEDKRRVKQRTRQSNVVAEKIRKLIKLKSIEKSVP